jgi:hypothetical protein
MNLHVLQKLFALSIMAILAISVVAGLSSQNALGQATQKVTPTAISNLTAGDFSGLTDNLIAARLGILGNNSESAYGAINAAGSGLFRLSSDAADGNETLIKQLTQQFRPLVTNLDTAREALRDENSTLALRNLNFADLNVLRITQELPSGGNNTQDAEEDEG